MSKIIVFFLHDFSKSNLRISAFIFLNILLCKYLFLSSLDKLKSFSMVRRDFGFFFKISSVNAPAPGPISITFLLLRLIRFIIFKIMFLSTKNFDLKIFYLNISLNF